MPRAKNPVAEAAETPIVKRRPRVSVLERRVQNPFGSPSVEIELKDRSLKPRWFNNAIIADKVWRAKNDGWRVVLPDEVQDLEQIGAYGLAPSGGHIVRGTRGDEVLMVMDKGDYKQIALAKTRVNNERMGNPHKATPAVLEAAAHGGVSAETVDLMDKQVRTIGGVTDSYERIAVTPEAES